MLHIKEKSVHEIFIISLVLKGIGSVLEILGGVLFIFTGKITDFLTNLAQTELLEDPNDFISTQIQHWVPYFNGHLQTFGAMYLLSHGIVKTFLVIGLLRNKLWAYPASITVLCLFIVYQLYRLTFGYSLFLIWLTIFDIFLIFLTWHEYKLVSKHLPLDKGYVKELP